jgi:hypothetical protein
MPRNYGPSGDGGNYGGETYDGTGGASGRYGPTTPLDPLHRRGVFETDERARLQEEAAERDPAPFAANDRDTSRGNP